MGGTDPVAESWRRIREWLELRAPAVVETLQAPADDAGIDRVGRETGLTPTAELASWWKQADGLRDAAAYAVIPSRYAPLAITYALVEWRTHLELDREIEEEDPGREDVPPEAGTYSARYAESFLPFAADGLGNVLFVDLREGALSGCVMEWEFDEGCGPMPIWSGIAEMLEDVGDSMELGREAQQDHASRMRRANLPAATYHPEPSAVAGLEWVMTSSDQSIGQSCTGSLPSERSR